MNVALMDQIKEVDAPYKMEELPKPLYLTMGDSNSDGTFATILCDQACNYRKPVSYKSRFRTYDKEPPIAGKITETG